MSSPKKYTISITNTQNDMRWRHSKRFIRKNTFNHQGYSPQSQQRPPNPRNSCVHAPRSCLFISRFSFCNTLITSCCCATILWSKSNRVCCSLGVISTLVVKVFRVLMLGLREKQSWGCWQSNRLSTLQWSMYRTVKALECLLWIISLCPTLEIRLVTIISLIHVLHFFYFT